MEAIEKAKLALRKHLLENREKIAKDLIAMREKSEGNDIFKYVDHISNAFSFENVTSSLEVTYDYDFPKIDYYNLINGLPSASFYSPPIIECDNINKDSEFSSGSFFLINLTHVRSPERSIFF